ncbi:MAG: glycosyltransferase [Chloroflexi bacterium]|nr:glycosyltransferase [Chloroflexota bacterium]
MLIKWPEVTVVIPMYNARRWIEETLQSVAHQTLPLSQIEILVVDDASTDDSVAVATTFLAEHGLRGRVISKSRNAGPSAARNTGWQLAKTEWVQFVDADDLLAPHKLAAQLAAALEQPADVAVVYSPWQHYAQRDGAWGRIDDVVSPTVDDDPVLRILQDFWFGYVGPTLIRTSVLKELGGLNEQLHLGEDFDLMLRIAMAGHRFHKVEVDQPAFFYRDTPDSQWRRAMANPQSMRDLLQVIRRVELFLTARGTHGLSVEAREALASRYQRCLESFMDRDPISFRQTLDWMSALQLSCPPGTGRNLRLMSSAVGYANAQRLRFSYRRVKRRLLAK